MDYKFYAKVGNKYLKNKKLVSKGRDEFECREESTQIINQMKKDGKIDKKAKVKIQKIKEACMENTYGYHLSPFSFSEPKINYKAGFGTSFYGAGFYITLDEDVVDTMKGEAQDMFAEYFIYTIKVDEQANIVDEGDEDGLTLYADLVEQFNGDEVKASAEMVKRGVDGILYYSEEDGHSIVFYNPKMAKIVKTEYHQGWGERSELNENAYDDAYEEDVEEQLREDWDFVLDAVQSIDPSVIESLRDIDINYVDTIVDRNDNERVAEFDPIQLSLNVSDIYFRLKPSIAVGVLLHELGHAVIVARYIRGGNGADLVKYAEDCKGHNQEWVDLCKQFESCFKNVKVPITLNLSDPDIYAQTR